MMSALLTFALAASGTADLQSVLERYRASQDVPGISAVVVRRDEVLFAGASGLADLASATPMSSDSVLYIGSVTKVLTAVLMLQLVEQGQVSLDETAAGLGLERASRDASITIGQLLTHSSGLEREGSFGYWFDADFPDNAELRRYLHDTQLRDLPGASLHYSNIGYAALGQVVEQLTGMNYSEALGVRVLTPLQMKASGGRGPAPGPAMGYTPVDRFLPAASRPFAGVGKRVGRRHERAYHDAHAMSPAFGAYSSANDMGELLRFLLGFSHKSLLSSATRSRMVERQASGWGLGLKIRTLAGRTVARHDGWFAAHRSHLLLDMHNGIGVVVLANSDNASPGEIAEGLLNAVLQDN